MIGFKLFRKRKDGSYGPLFINRGQRLLPGICYASEEHWTKGFAYRPGWHVCSKRDAPHLRQTGDRVWCRVYFTPAAEIDRPASQGGKWYLGSSLVILEELS
jgi:hypothetical protein